jgi:hypothetical protein
MFNVNRLKELRKVAQNPKESEYLQALVTILVELEHQQLEAVEDLHDALEIDGVQNNSDRETRREQLLDLADHATSGEFEDWWFAEVVGEHIENPEDARPYAALGDDAWQEQIETWADSYRERAEDELQEKSNEEIARMHVERTFGVSLEEFKRNVVDYSRKEALQTILAGNFEAVEAGIKSATATIEAGNLPEQESEA